jgi:hypothetical protein
MNIKNARSSTKAAARRLKSMPDEAIDYSDIPRLRDAFFKKAPLLVRPFKNLAASRLDEEK